MTTIGLIVVVVLIGLVLYFVPNLDATLKKILIAIAIICFCLWVLAIVVGLGSTDPHPLFGHWRL
jgi:hypothetical protein